MMAITLTGHKEESQGRFLISLFRIRPWDTSLMTRRCIYRPLLEMRNSGRLKAIHRSVDLTFSFFFQLDHRSTDHGITFPVSTNQQLSLLMELVRDRKWESILPAVRHLSLLPARRYAQTNDEQEEMKEALQLNGSVSVKTQIHEREESQKPDLCLNTSNASWSNLQTDLANL